MKEMKPILHDAVVFDIDEIIEAVEITEKVAIDELAAYGNIEFEPQFNWSRKADEHGDSYGMVDICRCGEGELTPWELF